jgi:hypothetical protein
MERSTMQQQEGAPSQDVARSQSLEKSDGSLFRVRRACKPCPCSERGVE